MSVRFDLPAPDHETQPWWDAAAEGRLVYKHCTACGHSFLYPRAFCPECWSEDVEWAESAGRGTVYTYSVVRQNDLPPFNERVPFVIAMVDLDEGPRLMTNIEGCEPEDVKIGMPVQVDYVDESDYVKPVFKPV